MLDYRTFDMVDMPPMTEYSLYIRAFAGSNAAQASVQCPASDTLADGSVQTDSIEVEERAVQCPDDQYIAHKGDKYAQVDLRRLHRFVRRAGSVMEVRGVYKYLPHHQVSKRVSQRECEE